MFKPKHFDRPGLSGHDNQTLRELDQWLSTPRQPLRTVAKTFLSDHELRFLAILKQHSNHHVFVQVQLICLVDIDVDSLTLDWENAGSTWWERPGKGDHFMEISMLSVDYVLYSAAAGVQCVIELDGPEHQYDPHVLEASIKLGDRPYKTLLGEDKNIADRVRLWNRDRIKEAALAGAKLKFRRFESSELRDVPKLLNRLCSEGVV